MLKAREKEKLLGRQGKGCWNSLTWCGWANCSVIQAGYTGSLEGGDSNKDLKRSVLKCPFSSLSLLKTRPSFHSDNSFSSPKSGGRKGSGLREVRFRRDSDGGLGLSLLCCITSLLGPADLSLLEP